MANLLDTFNRANESPLGAPWVSNTGTGTVGVNLTGNAAVNPQDGSGRSGSYYALSANDYSQCVIGNVAASPSVSAESNDAGPAIHCDGTGQFVYASIYWSFGGGIWRMSIYERAGGSFSALSDVASTITPVDGMPLRIYRAGGNIKFDYHDGSAWVNLITAAAGTLSGGFDGLFIGFDRAVTLDEWANYDTLAVVAIQDTGSSPTRNRPGRGPYSLGRYFRPSIDALTNQPTVYGVSLSESAAASDAISALLAAVGAIVESGSSSDSVSGLRVTAPALSESGSAADTVSATLVAVATIVETLAAIDALISALVAVGALSESGAATDSLSQGSSSYSVSLSESAAVADALSSVATLVASLGEAVTATDSISQGSSSYSVSLSEGAAAADALSAAIVAVNALAELAGAGDSLASSAALGGALSELGSASDVHSAVAILQAALAEAGVAVDLLQELGGLVPITDVARQRLIVVRREDRIIMPGPEY